MRIRLCMIFGLALSVAFTPALATAQTAGAPGSASEIEANHRTHLPMPNTTRPRTVVYDAKNPDSKNPPIELLRPPKGAPNVLVILLDDAGFGSSSAFGGPCQTPTLDKLAAGGLKFNRFHTTAICSPTRQALLTGRNHHSVGMAGITEIATGAPGYSSVRPNSMAPLAMTLKLNGYATAQFGKNHEVPVWETSPIGPFDAWPTGGGGFEYFYGFLGGEANQWYPTLYEGTTPVENKKTPEQGYHLMTDMTDKTIKWIAQEKVLAPDKPFFIYYAPGATHAPHHVPKEWADKYKGKFDQGWDQVREETFARQKKLGVIPADCQLTARPREIAAWDATPEAFKPVLRREMEVYAGYLEFTDYQVGRIVETLEKLNILDDTLIYYIVGDNGASAEGGINGSYNEMSYFNGLQGFETAEYLTERMDKLGGPESYNHYAVAWAHAMNTPYQWTKQVASHWGATRNATVVHWPNGIKAKGELRSQFTHVIDVAPTVLEAAKLPQPVSVNGIQQDRIEGTSMLYSFDNAKAPEQQIFSEWERMLELVRELALGMDVGFAWHTGSVPQARRREEVRRFKTDPGCRLFLSTDSGGVGLNLQAANVVINLDLPWNPARLEQRIARAWRKHQTRPVQVIYLVTENSIEQRMIPLLAGKQALADTVIDARGGQTAMPLPSGRKALVARLEALTGLTLATTPATTPEAAAQAGPPEPEEASPASSRPEGIDDATVAAIQRLAEAGLLELTEEGRRRLGLATPSARPGRDHRLPRARELFAQAERKLRMAAVLAGSGFAVESLPALREGLELGLRSQAHLEGQELSEAEAVSLEWIESRLPQHFPLIRKLRSESEALLGAQETEAQGWLAAVEQIAGEIRGKLAGG